MTSTTSCAGELRREVVERQGEAAVDDLPRSALRAARREARAERHAVQRAASGAPARGRRAPRRPAVKGICRRSSSASHARDRASRSAPRARVGIPARARQARAEATRPDARSPSRGDGQAERAPRASGAADGLPMAADSSSGGSPAPTARRGPRGVKLRGRPMSELNARARQVLYHCVTEYVATGEPVGSRTLSKKAGLDLSPASIRNVLSDLEEAGLPAPAAHERRPRPDRPRVPPLHRRADAGQRARRPTTRLASASASSRSSPGRT